ncbi:GAF and ANTAR domain-containing protein [Spirillospora sp. NPDC127200]
MDSFERVWRWVSERAAGGPMTLEVVLSAAAAAVEADGFGATLVNAPGVRELACASDGVGALIEEAQLASGEGPCSDAYRDLAPVLVPDLQAAADRWPGFVPAVASAEVRAVFAFPLQVAGIRVGAIDLYRHRPGPLTGAQFGDAGVFAELAGQVAFRAHPAPQELPSLGADEAPYGFPPVVHQAAGMLAAQLDIGVDQALLRLRAYAYLHGEPVTGTARQVIERRLTLDPHQDAHDGQGQ